MWSASSILRTPTARPFAPRRAAQATEQTAPSSAKRWSQAISWPSLCAEVRDSAGAQRLRRALDVALLHPQDRPEPAGSRGERTGCGDVDLCLPEFVEVPHQYAGAIGAVDDEGLLGSGRLPARVPCCRLERGRIRWEEINLRPPACRKGVDDRLVDTRVLEL